VLAFLDGTSILRRINLPERSSRYKSGVSIGLNRDYSLTLSNGREKTRAKNPCRKTLEKKPWEII
jgi:hypothetical protein